MKKMTLLTRINQISLPLMFTSITSLVMGMIDQMFVGHISIESFAGVGLVVTVINCIVGVLGVLSIGLVIQFYESNEDELNKLFSNYYVISVIIGLLFLFVIGVFSNLFLKICFGLEDKILYEGTKYLKIYSISILLNMQIFICNAVFKIKRVTSYIFISSVVGNIVNIGLDYCLIFGKYGLPKMETTGAAISTILSLMVTLFLEIMVILKKGYIYKFCDVCYASMRSIIKYNIPLVAQELLEGVVLVFVTNMIVGRMGAIALAIYNISQQLISIVLMPAYGYSSAINILINDNEYEKKDVVKSTFEISMIVYLLLGIIIYVNRYDIIGLFGEDYRFMNNLSIIIIISIISQGANYGFILMRAVLQSIGESKWILKLTLFINILVSIGMFITAKNLIILYILLGMNYLVICLSSVKRIKRTIYIESR